MILQCMRVTLQVYFGSHVFRENAIVSRGTWMAYENSRLDLCDEVGPGITALCEMIALVPQE